MDLLPFLEDPKNHPLLKRVLLVPLFFAVLLWVDYSRPDRIEQVQEFHIYGFTGGGRHTNSGKYLKTPTKEFTISEWVYYDLDHTKPIQIIRTPWFRTFKAIQYQSREFPDTTYEYRPYFSLYGLHFAWILIMVGVTLYGLLSTHAQLSAFAFIGSFAFCLLFLLIIILG